MHIRYNHKNGLFKLQDGRLDFSLVDMQYCLSYVLKGDWSCHLKHDELGEIFLDGGKLRMGKDEEGENIAYGTFSGLRLQDDDGKGGKKPAQYTLQIRQDPSIASAPRQAYKGAAEVAPPTCGARVRGRRDAPVFTATLARYPTSARTGTIGSTSPSATVERGSQLLNSEECIGILHFTAPRPKASCANVTRPHTVIESPLGGRDEKIRASESPELPSTVPRILCNCMFAPYPRQRADAHTATF